MASPAIAPGDSKVSLSRRDAWILYRLAYFPKVKEEKRLAMLNENGLTEAGRRIGRYLLGQTVPDLSGREKLIAERYKEAAQHDRLGLSRLKQKAATSR